MLVHFWGVRGSLPTPITPQQVQSKIMAAIQRITTKDLENQETKAKFISNLPSWILGTTGGNTSCVELKTSDSEIILDAGTGIRLLGKSKNQPKDKHYHILFSHFHWDHIQGLPFFDPAYNPNSSFDFYSPVENAEEILRNQMKNPYYPVTFDSFTKNITFHKVSPGIPFFIGNTKVTVCKMSHPGESFAYSFEENGKKFVYATDVELRSDEYNFSPDCEAVFKNADAVILDSQYTVEEAHKKMNWGHSAFCYAIDFAVNWKIKNIYLFHHEPTYDDKKLNSILEAARWYAHYIEHSEIQINLAIEDQEFTV